MCRQILQFQLESAGFDVIQAEDGVRGVEMAAVQVPDLILCDVMMPGCDGFEVIRRLRAVFATRNIPVIFLTAFDDEEMREEAWRLGAVGFFRKPFDDSEFMGAIQSVLSRA